MKPSRVIFFVLTLSIALLDTAFVVINQRALNAELKQQVQAQADQLRAALSTILDQTYSNLLMVATFVANDEQVQSLFLEGARAVVAEGGGAGGTGAAIAREALYRELADNWLEVQRQFSTRQLHFHLGPGSTSFLRVHRPERFGDNMDSVRFTIVDTIAEGVPQAGFETGRVYSGLRGVVPVQAKDPRTGESVLAGALEAGTAFDAVLDILKRNYSVEASVLLTQAHIEANMWPEAIDRRFTVSMPVCECVVEAATSDNIAGLVSSVAAAGLRLSEVDVRIVDHDGHPTLVVTEPLRDFRGTQNSSLPDAGRVVFWSDATRMLHGVQSAKRFNLLFAFVGFFIVETLLYLGLRLGVRRLEREIDARVADIQRSEHRLQRAQDIAGLAHWDWDASGNRVALSRQSQKMLGLQCPESDVTLETVLERVHPADRSAVEKGMRQAATVGGSMQMDHRIQLPDGGERTVQHFAEAEERDDGVLQLSSTLLDITERYQHQQELQQAATHDSLTGALNRAGFREQAIQRQAWAVRHAASITVLMLDADHFKRVNDAHGHESGDRVLVSIVATIGEILRPYDVLGRLGGEEFAVLMTALSAQEALSIAERLREAIYATKIALADGTTMRVTVSIGVVHVPSAEQDLDHLLDTADRALYAAKEGGRDRVVLFGDQTS